MTRPAELPKSWRVSAVVLFTVLGAMSSALEILLVPVYIGSVIFPITLVIVLLGNVYFPRAVYTVTGSTGLAFLPLISWIIVLIYLGIVPNPMGDVLLPGYGQGQYVGEGLLVLGLMAGILSAAVHRPPPRPAAPAPRPRS